MTITELRDTVEQQANAAHPRVLERMVDLLFAKLQHQLDDSFPTGYVPRIDLRLGMCNCSHCTRRRVNCDCVYCWARKRYTAIKIGMHHINRLVRGDYEWVGNPDMLVHYRSKAKQWERQAEADRAIMRQHKCCTALVPWSIPNKVLLDGCVPSITIGGTSGTGAASIYVNNATAHHSIGF